MLFPGLTSTVQGAKRLEKQGGLYRTSYNQSKAELQLPSQTCKSTVSKSLVHGYLDISRYGIVVLYSDPT